MSGHFFLYVLFDDFPRINAAALRQAVDGLEPGTSLCEASEFTMRATEQGSIYSGVVSCGPLNIAVQVYGQPLAQPSFQATAEVAHMPEADRDRLRRHRVHARLTCLGGDDEQHPVDNMVLLWKVAMALTEQGGLAVANENNCTCLPAQVVASYAQQAREDAAASQPWRDHPSLWNMLRNQGMPGEMLVGFLAVDIRGEFWCLSAGQHLYGLPELACRAKDPHDAERIEEHFRNIFQHLFEHGPVVHPGESLNFDGIAGYKFHALPANMKSIEAPHGTLVVTINEGEIEEEDPLRDWDF